MGEDTVDKAIEIGGLKPASCKTTDLPVHGSLHGLSLDDPLYYYGSDREALLALTEENPDWGAKLHPKYEYLQAQVIWAVRHEMARTIEDTLARRIRLLFLDARAALDAAPLTAALMAAELKKNAQWQQEQVSMFHSVAANYILQP